MLTTNRAVALALVITLFSAEAAAQTYCNNTAMAIPDSGPASLYPSTVTVSGATPSPVAVFVTINGLTHTFPSDLDFLLVGPAGQKMLIQSDMGITDQVASTYTIVDSGERSIPLVQPWAGRYRPTNFDIADSFAAPAPAPPYGMPGSATLRSVFGGIDPNGTWQLYAVDDRDEDGGTIAQGWCLSIGTASAVMPLRISELSLRGSMFTNDEYIELMNVSDLPYTVAALNGTTGFVFGSPIGGGCTIPNGVVIPPYGHFLCVGGGYQLSQYPGGNGADSNGDLGYFGDLPDNAGIALFSDSAPALWTLANRIDAAGSTSESNPLLREGAGYPTLVVPLTQRYAWVRDDCGKGGATGNDGTCVTPGIPRDTNDNAADFVFVDTGGIDAGAGSRLGAPGPQNLESPTYAGSEDGMAAPVLDSCSPQDAQPNVRRDMTSDPANNSLFGTLSAHRTFTNSSAASIKRLRFRVVDLTTYPPADEHHADLRARTSDSLAMVVDRPPCGTGYTILVPSGTTLEQPPNQSNGGGLNASLSVPGITDAAPLAAGASINVRLLFGVQQPGYFRIALVPETSPRVTAQEVVVSGCTDGEVPGNPLCSPPVLSDPLFADGFELP